jgi:hypothetical protein
MRIVRLAVVLVLLATLALAALFGWRWWRSGRGVPAPAPQATAVGAARVAVPETERAPDGVRIRVQVLNGTDVRGLARRAMLMLRDRGFDVVEIGNADAKYDSTLVLDRSGHPDWAGRVGQAMGGARVEARPDTSRYLDVTVLIGRSWTPPAEPFYP